MTRSTRPWYVPLWPLLGASALLAGLALPIDGIAQNKQKAKKDKADDPAKVALAQQYLVETDGLRNAFGLLAGANHDYQGHRVKAMHQVKLALKTLDGQIAKLGSAAQKAAVKQRKADVAAVEKAAKSVPRVTEPQPLSDRQLLQAAEVLASVRGTLLSNQQQNVLVPVDAAIQEIGIALSLAVSPVYLAEADALQNAFALLAGANHDYQGHRAKAMKEIKGALKHLDNHVLKYGAAAQKATIDKRGAAVLVLEQNAAKLVLAKEPQPLSDAQLGKARDVLAAVSVTLTANQQQAALGHVQAAIQELGVALKIN